MAIDVSIAGVIQCRITVGMGESKEEKWHEARNETDPEETENFVKYPPNGYIFPFSWQGTSIVGVRRAILFFDTTGQSGDMVLRLWNSRDSSPCYTGGTHYFRVLDGSGADPDFDEAIYGWMLGRMGAEYLIGEKLLSSIDCQSWGEVFIPSAYINGAGYTILIVTTDDDQEDNYSGSSCGTSLMSHLSQVQLHNCGYEWVEGDYLAYLDIARQKRLKLGTLTGVSGKTPGYTSVDGTYKIYVDASGNVRYIEGALTGLTGKIPGQISINIKSPMIGTHDCYIDDDGAERCFEGTVA